MIMRIFKNIYATSLPGLLPLENGIDGKRKQYKNRAADARAFTRPSHFLREKALGTGFIFASRVNFNIDDADGSEIVTFKINSPFFQTVLRLFQFTENVICTCRPVSLKLIFCSRAGTEKKCTKMKALSTCKIVVLFDKPFTFLTFSSPSSFKVPNARLGPE